MLDIFLIITGIACVLILAWNFLPGLRARLRGYTTFLENVLGAGVFYFGIATDSLQELVDKGYIPENYMIYVPFILFAAGILARAKTKTPAGKA